MLHIFLRSFGCGGVGAKEVWEGGRGEGGITMVIAPLV